MRYVFPFVNIEAIDGVGKTITAKLFAQIIKGVYYKTPSGHFETLRANADLAFRNQPGKRFKFYFNSVKFASKEISIIIQERAVVCDRYIWSTLAYHEALGIDLSKFDLGKTGIVIPHYTFLLHANEEVREKRIRDRGNWSTSDRYLEQDRALQRRVQENFLKYPLIPIDTSYLTVYETCERMLSVIHEIYSHPKLSME